MQTRSRSATHPAVGASGYSQHPHPHLHLRSVQAERWNRSHAQKLSMQSSSPSRAWTGSRRFATCARSRRFRSWVRRGACCLSSRCCPRGGVGGVRIGVGRRRVRPEPRARERRDVLDEDRERIHLVRLRGAASRSDLAAGGGADAGPCGSGRGQRPPHGLSLRPGMLLAPPLPPL